MAGANWLHKDLRSTRQQRRRPVCNCRDDPTISSRYDSSMNVRPDIALDLDLRKDRGVACAAVALLCELGGRIA